MHPQRVRYTYSDIGPSGDCVTPHYDRSTFGYGHTDSILAVTLRSLRLYRSWTDHTSWAEAVSPGVDTLVCDAGLDEGEAVRLHELLNRMSRPIPTSRHHGSAIPSLL